MKWTTEKVEELRRRYPHEDNARLAHDLGCSRKALVFRASSLGLRKTEAANEARYAAMSKRPTPQSLDGERREIATGTLIVRGNVLTHLSNFSAAREQARAAADGDSPAADAQESCAPYGASPPPARADGTRITCPRCQAQFTHPALAASQAASSMEA